MRGIIFGVVAGGAVFFNTDSVSGDSYVWLSLAGLAARFIDSVAGGGGLITVPALMYVGLPVHLALGTNKMQSSFGTCVAVWRYWGAGLISSTQIQYSVFWTLAAAAAGAWCVGKLDASEDSFAIPKGLEGEGSESERLVCCAAERTHNRFGLLAL